MELRRALLLFAIVLGLAAIATSFSRPREEKQSDSPRTEGALPSARPRFAGTPTTRISFAAGVKPRAERLGANRPAAVTVEVPRPGQVQLEGLGLNASAEPLTPARFDVLATMVGSYDVLFTPAASGETRAVGTLRIVP